MWSHSSDICRSAFIVFIVISLEETASKPITNTDFSNSVREYAAKDDKINSTLLKTLQKQNPEIYGNFAPIHNSIKFKTRHQEQVQKTDTNIPDNALSSSVHSREILHEHSGYGLGLYDYETGHNYGHGYGYDDYRSHDFGHPHFAPHQFPGHHDYYHTKHGHHNVGYGYHHKNYDHSLVTKTLLWPLAGLALLGTAAALVSNPVLLQLGVVGRKKRDTKQIIDHDIDLSNWSNREELTTNTDFNGARADVIRKRTLEKRTVDIKQGALLRKVLPERSSVETIMNDSVYKYNKVLDDGRFIPPLTLES